MSLLINSHVRLINGLSTTNHGMASRGYEHKYQLCVTRTAHRPGALEGARRAPQTEIQPSIIVMHIGHRGVTRD